MYVEDLFQKLRPIFGKKIDKLWLLYISEDAKGKRHIEQIVNFMAIKAFKQINIKEKILLEPPPKDLAEGEYTIGQIFYGDKPFYSFGLREDEWIQHVAIFGRTGAGKTNLAFIIIWNLFQKQKPFLIFDWKRNYRDILALNKIKNILIFTVGRNISPFNFNPLIPPKGTNPKVWIKKLIEILAHAYFIGEGVMHLLQESLDYVYKKYEVYETENPEYPIFKDVLEYLKTWPVKGRKALWMDSALRVLSSLTFGGMGDVINTKTQLNIEHLLKKNVILELDALTNSDKTFLIESILLWVHHYRLCQGKREQFIHAIIVEEAHHILLKNKYNFYTNELITDIILREIRELGESIILIDQHPSLISLPALGNSHSTISFNLKHQYDVNSMANAMLLDQKEYFGQLPVGNAIVKLQSRYCKPFLVRIPLFNIEKGLIKDDDVKAHMQGYSGYRELFCPEQHNSEQVRVIPMKAKIKLTEPEQALLTDVLKNPLSSIKQRYHRLGLSSYRGNKLQNKLINLELIKPVNILTKKGRVKLFDLRDKCKLLLPPPLQSDRKSEGIEHLYWKHTIAEYLRGKGFNVEIEKPINGSIVDIVASKPNQTLAVEVETGKSDYMLNLRAMLSGNFDKVALAVTNREFGRRVKKQILKSNLDKNCVFVILAKDFTL